MNTQQQNSTDEIRIHPQKEGALILRDLEEMEIIVRHMMSDEYRQAIENEMVTPILAQLLLQKIHNSCKVLIGE